MSYSKDENILHGLLTPQTNWPENRNTSILGANTIGNND